jgi:hypothetical protein
MIAEDFHQMSGKFSTIMAADAMWVVYVVVRGPSALSVRATMAT